MSVTEAVHEPLPEPAWGTLLAVYFVLIGIPSGLTLVSWWLRHRGGTEATAVERYSTWIALSTLVVASLLLVVDLGRPFRFYLMLTRFDNFGSPIAIGAKLIAIKIFLLGIVLYSMERRRRADPLAADPPARGLTTVVNSSMPWLLVAASMALAIYPASVLSWSWASPLANTSGAALIFLLTALLMGTAVAVLIATAFGTREHVRDLQLLARRALLVLVGLLGIALAFAALSLNGNPSDRRLFEELAAGSFAMTFWGLVVGVGIVVPAVGLSIYPSRRTTSVVSAAAVLIGAAATRYLIFSAGP